MDVTVLGTGTMGAGITRSLIRAGHRVTVWNRSPARARPLTDDGARVAGTVTEAVAGAQTVLTVLYDTASVREVADDLLAALPEDGVWLQAATIGAEGTEMLARLASDHGRAFCECQLLGTRGPAENGTLVLLTAGAEQAQQQVTLVLEAIGSRVVRAGDVPGAASRLKLACNTWLTGLAATVGQSFAVADGLGVDPALVLAAVDGGPLDSPYAHMKAQALLDGATADALFTLHAATKDAALARDAARESGTDTTLLDAVLTVAGRAADAGYSDHDVAALRFGYPRA